MYNEKYCIEKIEEFNRHNPIYEGIEGSVCFPAYLNVGERGWVLYIRDDWFDPTPHRLHTSIIKSVVYTSDNRIIVETENTRFTFALFTDSGNK